MPNKQPRRRYERPRLKNFLQFAAPKIHEILLPTFLVASWP